MNKKTLIAVGIAAALVAGTVVFAQSAKPAAATPDPRIDKLIEQNEQILKNQQDIIKTLGEVQTALNVLKRRST